MKVYTLLRLLVEAMVMTGSDLCASAKPWNLQLETVSVIYEEFYIQVKYLFSKDMCDITKFYYFF